MESFDAKKEIDNIFNQVSDLKNKLFQQVALNDGEQTREEEIINKYLDVLLAINTQLGDELYYSKPFKFTINGIEIS